MIISLNDATIEKPKEFIYFGTLVTRNSSDARRIALAYSVSSKLRENMETERSFKGNQSSSILYTDSSNCYTGETWNLKFKKIENWVYLRTVASGL